MPVLAACQLSSAQLPQALQLDAPFGAEAVYHLISHNQLLERPGASSLTLQQNDVMHIWLVPWLPTARHDLPQAVHAPTSGFPHHIVLVLNMINWALSDGSQCPQEEQHVPFWDSKSRAVCEHQIKHFNSWVCEYSCACVEGQQEHA